MKPKLIYVVEKRNPQTGYWAVALECRPVYKLQPAPEPKNWFERLYQYFFKPGPIITNADSEHLRIRKAAIFHARTMWEPRDLGGGLSVRKADIRVTGWRHLRGDDYIPFYIWKNGQFLDY